MCRELTGWYVDMVFLIYLYQRWIYPVDKTRVNEFGQGGEDEEGEKTDAATATSETDDANNNSNNNNESSSAPKDAEAKKKD